MLSILPFDRVTSAAAAAASSDRDRPFKAYPARPHPQPVPSAAYPYGPFAPPTFVDSVGIPASHTSTSLKNLNDLRHHQNVTSTTMDPPPTSHGYHGYPSTSYVNYASASYSSEPLMSGELVDMSIGGSHFRHHSESNPLGEHTRMGMTIPHNPVHIKPDHDVQDSPHSVSSTSHNVPHNTPATPQPRANLPPQATPVQQTHPSSSSLFQNGGGASHTHPHPPPPHGGLARASGGTPPETPRSGPNTSTSAGSTTDSSPSGSNAESPSASSSSALSRIPPKKRPLSVPEEHKDATYWEKRKKNNESAKRSRDARRQKEQQIGFKVVALEEEKQQLLAQLNLLKDEVNHLRHLLFQQSQIQRLG